MFLVDPYAGYEDPYFGEDADEGAGEEYDEEAAIQKLKELARSLKDDVKKDDKKCVNAGFIALQNLIYDFRREMKLYLLFHIKSGQD